MAYTKGISHIQVIYPDRLIIGGSLTILGANLSAGVSILVESGQSAKTMDGNTVEISEKVRATAEIVGLSAADRASLLALANTSVVFNMVMGVAVSTVDYDNMYFTGIPIVTKKITAGQQTKYFLEIEVEGGNSESILTYQLVKV